VTHTTSSPFAIERREVRRNAAQVRFVDLLAFADGCSEVLLEGGGIAEIWQRLFNLSHGNDGHLIIFQVV